MTEPVAYETFDAYHKWLGISPKDQPPHYYRLLAVDLFESDADVISAAADKQMAFIRSFQSGKNSQLSQKILNEIATARVCLLNLAKKAEYDAALRLRMAAAPVASGLKKARPIPVVAAAPTDHVAIDLAELVDADAQVPPPMQMGGNSRSQIRTKKSKKSILLPLTALGVMLVVCVVAIFMVMSRPPENHVSQAVQDPDSSPPGDAKPVAVGPAIQDTKLPVSANKGKPAPPKSSSRPLGSNERTDPATPDKPPAASTAQGASANQPTEKPSGENRPDIKPGIGDPPRAGRPAPVRKPETPAQPAETEKLKTLEELDKQLADAKTSEDYQTVALDGLRAAGKAMDDHQPDAAKQLILKSLIAARKAGDSKLIIKATRALTKPESVQEILAE